MKYVVGAIGVFILFVSIVIGLAVHKLTGM